MVRFPDLPECVTSFGAAIAGDHLYVYGGHTGEAHEYARDTQAHTLRRLHLSGTRPWEELGEGPPLQGLALVSHLGKLYRLGGFAARNQAGAANDLWSQSAVSLYDPTSNRWTELPALPEPRSSFDAVVLGGTVYVVGGWQLQGGDQATWLTTACALDLEAPTAWQPLPAPPFQRRALSAAAFAGKLYVIGGMQQYGGPTTRVDVFDPQVRQWSLAPSLPGEPMEGFGSAAFAVGNRLCVSTTTGRLLCLRANHPSWTIIGQLDRARFFHRMLPLDAHHVLLVGGANMSIGKWAQIDMVRVDA